MAEVPTPEENARKILALFQRANLRAGQVMMAGALRLQATQAGMHNTDIMSGLGFARDHGWIEDGPNGTVRLTDAGFSAV